MANYSVIMFPGAWDTEATSFQLAKALAGYTREMPIDISRRMRNTGIAVQKLTEQVADDCVNAIKAEGHDAAKIMDFVVPWQIPEVRTASRITTDGLTLDYEAGSYKESLSREEMLFMHVSWQPPRVTRAASTARPDGTGVEKKFVPAAEGLTIDVHCGNPRIILRFDIKTTKYRLAGEAETDFLFVRPERLLAVMNRFAQAKLVFPDARLLVTEPSDPLWETAQVKDVATLRSRSSWYRVLQERNLLAEAAAAMKKAKILSSPTAEFDQIAVSIEITNEFADQLAASERWLKRGMGKRALKEAEKAVSMKPDRPEGYRARAHAHAALGNAAAAGEDMKRAEEIEKAR